MIVIQTSSLLLVSFSNAKKIVIPIELIEEEENSSDSKSDSNEQNFPEQEEQQLTNKTSLNVFLNKSKKIDTQIIKKLFSTFIETPTPPPLF